MAVLPLKYGISLQTRGKSDLTNEVNLEPLDDGQRAEAEAYAKKFPNAIPRPVRPGNTFNCHGLTFASRRTQLWKNAEVMSILKEDQYEEVKLSDVMAGDIVAYYSDESKEFEHTGIVIDSDGQQAKANGTIRNPLVLSKWGCATEFIHRVGYHPYAGLVPRYFRVKE